MHVQPQPFIKYLSNSSLLLSAPNNIIFELFNTIIHDLPETNFMEFMIKNFCDYLSENWTNKMTQRAVKRLRREQAIDIKAGLKGIPVIASKNGHVAVKQVYEHIMWRIRSNNVTQITSLIIKQALDDGYKRGILKAVAYDDVFSSFEEWRSIKLIKLYAFGNAPANDQKLILSNTQAGDLTKWIANFVDGSEKRRKPDLLAKLSGALRDKRKNCMYITNDIDDARMSIQTGSIRCVLVVDRLRLYDSIETLRSISPSIEPMITGGQIYILSSLNCIQFVPDPTSDNCC